jgi:hypothetical protein
MTRFFEDLEAQLHAAARAQTGAGGEPDPPRRGGWLRRVARSAPVAVAIVITVAVVVVALTLHGRHHAATPHRTASAAHRAAKPAARQGSSSVSFGTSVAGVATPVSPRQAQAFKFITPIDVKVLGSKACRLPKAPPTTFSQGSPSAALLSLLGVLRRPATPQDKLTVPGVPRGIYPVPGQDVYVRYVRRARVTDGVSYYVIPVGRMLELPETSQRCVAAQENALRNRLAQIPAAERALTVAFQQQLLSQQLRTQKRAQQEGVCLMTVGANQGGGACGYSLSEIEHGGSLQSTGPDWSGVVPDGVASITLRAPARKGIPALDVTSDVVGNVFVVHATSAQVMQDAPTEIWRSAQGTIIKTISPPGS